MWTDAHRLHSAKAIVAIEHAYRPRNPEDNPLYGVVAGHLETFLARQRGWDRNVPGFVEKCGAPHFLLSLIKTDESPCNATESRGDDDCLGDRLSEATSLLDRLRVSDVFGGNRPIFKRQNHCAPCT